MSRRNRMIRRLEARWIACCGEPPPIRTDPDLMLAILEEAEARQRDAAPAGKGLTPLGA
ncbi:hypothetical protein ACO2Q3_13830 [Caulobacter sp. KR2-114]|uniref:hypothetical protein n=1 Tax=Caulobacter sp. KR2-114 TaxID=3400912 RepID=UPI003C078BFA